MMRRKDPPQVEHRLPPRRGVETKQEAKEEEVVVPLALHAVPIQLVGDRSSVEGLVDPPSDRDRDVLLTRSVESILASEATRELKVAHVRDTFRVNATREDV